MPARIVLGRETQRGSLWGFLFVFAGTSELFQLGSLLEFPRWRLGTIFVWCLFGSFLGYVIPGDSFSGIPPCFSPLGFTLVVRLLGTPFPPLGVYCSSPVLGNYINHQMMDCLRFPRSSCRLHIYVKLK